MSEPRDIVDIPGLTPPDASPMAAQRGGDARPPRPWLGIWFRCCHTYGRLYREAAGSRYVGRCPTCGGEVSARVGQGGTSRRLFEAS